uniref:Transcriptional activator protein n=1 Tax=Tomato leaf curl New Delhi virus TaxID=223347 RepID=A0A2D1P848_9GEMI|nr:AC2 [Tomato leaf curl New Delhi virus]
MQSSSHSKNHSIPVAKTSLPHKRKKSIRRRRVDLPCGCTYYISINCHDDGFTHRGSTSLRIEQRVAYIPGKFKIPCISKFWTTPADPS